MMTLRSSLRAVAALGLVCVAGLAQAQAFIKGSVSGQLAPGVYGRVDIGNAPPPPVLYAQPMMAVPPAVVMPHAQPQYLWVPPGHAKNWRKHCGRYNACGQNVYFLRNPPPNWQARPSRPGPHHVAPRPYDRHDRDWDRGHDHHRGDRDHRHERRDWDRHDDRRGNGHGKGHGHGRGRHDD